MPTPHWRGYKEKMKKTFFFTAFYLLAFFCFSSGFEQTNNITQSWQQELTAGNSIYEKYYQNIKIIKNDDNEFKKIAPYYLAPYYYTEEIIKRNDLTVQWQINYQTDVVLNENGFLSFTCEGKSYYFLPHHKWAIMYPFGYIPDSMSIEKQKKTATTESFYPQIVNEKASSFLTEKTKNGICEYGPEYITYYAPFYGIILPWVEGAIDDGVSEYIEFDVKNGRALYILNGYVDPSHPELFKNNGRIKKAKFEVIFEDGREDTVHVDFMDFVYYKEVMFNKRLKHVKITIEEVYSGKKYKDTCISQIFTDCSFEL